MKILLINPPPFDHGENSRFLEKTPIKTYTMPLGLGYLASFLERAGYHTDIVDAYAKDYSPETIREIIRDRAPRIIGITCLSDQRASWFRLVKLIRETDAAIRVVLGGPHPTLMTRQVLTQVRPDAIVIGEGEETMLELVRTWEKNGDPATVKGIAYLRGDEMVITGQRERIADLDSLPFPAYHKVDLNDYSGWDFMNWIYPMFGLSRPPRYATISTSRGCVGDCGYCSAPLIWKRRWTRRSPANVVDEFEMLHREYDREFIILTDDIFSVNQERVIGICREILRRDLKILWGFETAVHYVSPEMLSIAKQAGCCCILYGVESASETVLQVMNKRIRREDVVRAFRITKEAGIVAGAFLMVGSPGENEESINRTIGLLREIQPDIILPQIAMITPGTRIFARAKEKGCIDEDYWLTDLPFPYYTCERKLSTLLRWYRKLFYYRESDLQVLFRTIGDFLELRTGIRLGSAQQ
ncbi:MAG: B12-binding domain-containing radical SAM protein [Nitrospirota bacterium]